MARAKSRNGAKQPEPDVTSGSDFRSWREGEKITIPLTGRVVRMRVVRPAHLLQLGDIPDSLAELAMKVLYGPMSNEEYQSFFALPERREHAQELMESFRVVCTAALMDPRIVEKPEAPDEIHIDDLEDMEKRFIFDLALLEATALRRFRQQQEENVSAVESGEEPEPEAERDVGS